MPEDKPRQRVTYEWDPPLSLDEVEERMGVAGRHLVELAVVDTALTLRDNHAAFAESMINRHPLWSRISMAETLGYGALVDFLTQQLGRSRSSAPPAGESESPTEPASPRSAE